MSAIDTTECPVCYTEENVGKLGCGHPICGGCKTRVAENPASSKPRTIATNAQCPHGQNPSHIIKLIMCPICRQFEKLSYEQLEMENLYLKRRMAIMEQQANRQGLGRGLGHPAPALPPAVLIFPAPAPAPAPAVLRLGNVRRVRCVHQNCQTRAPTQRRCTGRFCTQYDRDVSHDGVLYVNAHPARDTPCCARCEYCPDCIVEPIQPQHGRLRR